MYHLIFIVKIKNNMKVCILGNNLSGLTLAKTLINQNIYVDFFVNKKKLILNKSRTIGISKNNLDFINANVININNLLWDLNRIEIYSDNLKNERLINFEDKKNKIFSIIKNQDLYKILNKSLSKSKYFKKIFINDKKLPKTDNYKLIINNDFSHDFTRKYFSKKIIKKYNNNAYTTIIEHEKIINDVATQIFTKNGPLAFLPISNTKTSIVYSVDNYLKNKNIEKLIKFYNFKYKIKKINKIDSFQLRSVNLRSYYHKNILAFGDLLHKIHPLAGQGFNMTIRDIKTLLSLIKKKTELGLPLDISINKDFENIQKYKNTIFLNGVDFIHGIFDVERKVKSKILTQSIKFLVGHKIANNMLKKIANNGTLF